MSQKVLQVFIFKSGEFVDTDVFSQNRVLVGRDTDSADLVLNSTHVSRRHAVIEHDGTKVTVQDAGSKNGIYVNDEKVVRREVTRHDKITVGDFTLKMKLLESENEATRTRAVRSEIIQGATMEGSFTNEITPPNNLSILLQGQTGGAPAATPGQNREVPRTPIEIPAPRDTDVGRTDDFHREEVGTDDLVQTGDSLRPADDTPSPGGAHRFVDAARSRAASAPQGRGDRKPAPPAQHSGAHDDDDDDDDHDDEDENFQAPFSLAKVVLREQVGGRESVPHVEVMTVAHDKVIDFNLLRQGSGAWQRRPNVRIDGGGGGGGLRTLHVGAGECAVVCDDSLDGRLRRGHDTVEVAQVFSPGPVPGACHGTIRPGDMLNLSDGKRQFYLRYVNPPPVIPDTRSFWQKISMDGQLFYVAAASLLAHLLVVGLVSFLAGAEEAQPKPHEEFDVTVKKEPELQEPPPKPEPPKPEPPKPPEPPPKPQKPQKVARKQPKQAPPKQVSAKPFVAPPNPAPPGILGLLNKKGATAAPGPVAAVQAVSNLSAVKVPGNQGSYRVSGLIGKLPNGAGISAGGGGGGPVTKGGAALLRGGGGAARLADQGDRHVGGMVQKAPRAMKTAGQGSLDRALIEKVVNEHTDEIQRCYEKELLHDSTLQGKVQVEWTISMEGTVPNVRQVSSSVRSTAVVTCIMGAIRTWKFPRPQGGPVLVNYPFILKGIDF